MLLQDLRALCAVIDEGSFTRAAERLSLTQPAVTKQVQRLEEELNKTLIDRSHREPVLTEAGDIVYAHAKRMLKQVLQCESALEALETQGQGHLSIGAVPSIVLFSLPRILGPYRLNCPRVTLHVLTGLNHEILNKVLHNDVDIGMCTVPLSHEQVCTLPLFYDRVVLIAAPGSSWSKSGRISATELSQLPMIGYQRGSRFRNFVDASFESAGISPNIVMEFDSHEAIKVMVRLGYGVAMVPFSSMEADLAAGVLACVEVDGLGEIGRTTSLLFRYDHPKAAAFEAFLAQAAEVFPHDERARVGASVGGLSHATS